MADKTPGSPARAPRQQPSEPDARIGAFFDRAFARGLPLDFVKSALRGAVTSLAERAAQGDLLAETASDDPMANGLLRALSFSVRRFVEEHLEALESDEPALVPEAGIRDVREIEALLGERLSGHPARIPESYRPRVSEFAIGLRISALGPLLAHAGAPRTAAHVEQTRARMLSGQIQARTEETVSKIH